MKSVVDHVWQVVRVDEEVRVVSKGTQWDAWMDASQVLNLKALQTVGHELHCSGCSLVVGDALHRTTPVQLWCAGHAARHPSHTYKV